MQRRDSCRPNILFILSDDQGCWAMGCAGNREIRTPNLDRLAAMGMRFDQFFCVSPVCSPARASILTGRIPSQHGIHDWLRAGNTAIDMGGQSPLIEYLKGQAGYSDLLAGHGYTCGFSGKWHLGDSHHAQKGFTFWEPHATGGGPYYGAAMIRDGGVYREPRYVTDVITDNALKFLDQQVGAAGPFYLGVHYTAPHSPWEREQHPAEVFDSYWRTCAFESTPDVPPHPWQINSAPCGDNPEHRRAVLSGYFTAVTEMDRNIGRLIDWLERHDATRNTLVVFTSDNGMNMGHHGIYGKGNGTFPLNMYDTSVKVPMLAAMPGTVPEGSVCDVLLSHYDLMPTLLDCAGAANPDADRLPGQSFAAALRGAGSEGRGPVVVLDEYGPVRMIRTREWKYVHRFPYGPHELFDLVHDPEETANRAEDPAAADVRRDLKARLDEWFFRYVDPAVDGVREPVTGKGQTGLAGVAAGGSEHFAADWHYVRSGTRIR